MINIFKKIPVYIKIFPNKIEVTNIQTDQTISKSSQAKFSSSRLIVAEFNAANNLLSGIIKELGLARRTLKVLIQQMDDFEEELSETEKRVLRDLSELAGASEVHIINRKKAMSKNEIQEYLQLKT